MNTEIKSWNLEIGNLFKEVGLPNSGLVEINENTYDFDPNDPKNSWLYGAFVAFKKLKNEGFNPKSFASIGTGSGVDSIGANQIFSLKEIYQTDIHPNVIEVTEKNVKSFVEGNVKVQTFVGDLCEPLIKEGIKVDLLYVNIPNIPSAEDVFQRKISASKFSQRDEKCPEIFKSWLLELQYLFLKQAKSVLNSDGVIVQAIGARVPDETIEKLFIDNGFKVNELVTLYKIQTEPEDILSGYSQAENENTIFDFYDHKKAYIFWKDNLEGKNLKAKEVKEALLNFKISAKEALEMFNKGGEVGHIYTVFKVTL